MAQWQLLHAEREYHNEMWDLIPCLITYNDGTTIRNIYRIGKDEKRIPYHLLRSRKWDESVRTDGKKWVEGTVKGRHRKKRTIINNSQFVRITPREDTYIRGKKK